MSKYVQKLEKGPNEKKQCFELTTDGEQYIEKEVQKWISKNITFTVKDMKKFKEEAVSCVIIGWNCVYYSVDTEVSVKEAKSGMRQCSPFKYLKGIMTNDIIMKKFLEDMSNLIMDIQ